MALGYQSLTNITEGDFNVAMGQQALYVETSGDRNVGVGQASLRYQVGKNDNAGFGYATGYFNNGGSENTFLGNLAGAYYGTGTGQNASVTRGIYLGYKSRASASGNTNEIVIGRNAVGKGSNTIKLGNTATTALYLNNDNYKLYFGADDDEYLEYDPTLDGIQTAGKFKAGSFVSSDGSAGATGTFTTADSKTVTVKDGLIVSII
jgi:hypothetical protein